MTEVHQPAFVVEDGIVPHRLSSDTGVLELNFPPGRRLAHAGMSRDFEDSARVH